MRHEVAKVERQPMAGRIRVSAYVVVSGQPSRGDLEVLADDIAEQFRESDRYAALWLGFYDRPEFVEGGDSAPLGHWIHAPHGRFGDAVGPDAGNYRTYRASNNLRDKDWSRQPTERDVELWGRYLGLGDQFHGAVDPLDFDTDPDAIAEMLVEIEDGRAADELKAALRRVALWTST